MAVPSTETITNNIPTIKLTTELLKKLTDIIDVEYKKGDQKAYSRLTFRLSTTSKEFAFGNSDDFLGKGLPRDLRNVYMKFTCGDRAIRISIDTRKYLDSDFSVEGTDSNWVNGVAKRIEEIFQEYETNNAVFHYKWKKAVPIYLALSILLSAAIFLAGSMFIKIITSEGRDVTTIGWLVLSGGIGIFFLLIWQILLENLFPKVEIDTMSQVKYRKKLVAGIAFVLGTIILGLITNYISNATLPKP